MPFEPPMRRPPMHVDLLPAWFAADYHDTPTQPTRAGLRQLGEGTIQSCHMQALEWASEAATQPSVFNDLYNVRVRSLLVANALCHAEDQAITFFELAEDAVPLALTIEGITLIFEQWELLRMVTFSTSATISFEEIDALAALAKANEGPKADRFLRALKQLHDWRIGL